MDSPAPARGGPAVAACIALGSNLGPREEHLRAALAALAADPEIAVVAVSAIYETDPLGPGPQGPYLNAAARIETRHPPRALLRRLLAVEAARGRRRDTGRWGARTLDLDLLLYGDRTIDEPGLRIPHPRLAERPFVLTPLAEVAAEWRHPELGLAVAELERARRDPRAVRRWPGGREASEPPGGPAGSGLAKS
jgi:2-amino-4-hydroxy-6-hydroxymethyldihydropteridine diphosphokinase